MIAESHDIPSGYKQTDVGVIPADWGVVLLEEYAQVRSGIAKNANIKLNNPIRVPYLRVANVQDGFLDLSEMSEIDIERSDLRQFSVVTGDVLMNEGGDRDKLGRGCVWSGQYTPCVHQNHVFVVRCTAKLHPLYLTAYSSTAAAKQFFIDAGSQTTNLASINKTAIGKLPIAVPPTLAEQEAIAEALGDADALIESLEQLVAKKRHLKQAAMQQLLTGKKRLPGFEGEWGTKRLGEMAEVTAGGTPSRTNPAYWNGDIPWVTTTEIDFRTIVDTAQRITSAGLANSAAKLYPLGTLLMALYGQGKTRGKVGILGIEAATNQACAAIEIRNGASPNYVLLNLMSRYDEIRDMSNTGNQENLNGQIVKDIVVPLPSEEEQTAITDVLSDMDTEIEAIEAKLAKARQIKQGMMQELLAGRTRLV